MKKKKFFKICTIFIIAIFCINLMGNVVNAQINQEYLDNAGTANYNVDEDSSGLLSTISEIVMPIIFPIFTALSNITKVVMYSFTGDYFFPWADSILFNKIEFLDINFINPAPGSLFLSSDGTETIVGQSVRNVYFTILAICIAFLGIAVAINAIKLIFSSMASNKAKYKEAINSTILTLVLIFGMHYLISFVFYINEQLVSIAADVGNKLISSETIVSAQESLREAQDKDNEKIVENFWIDCDHTSAWSPITILKKAFKEGVNLIGEIVDKLKSFFSSVKSFFFGDDEPTDVEISEDDDELRDTYYEEIFPSKKDFIGYFKDESKVGKNGIDIAAYLLKNYTYRDYMLCMVAGNDTNKFSNGGFWGVLQSASNTVLWFTGIIDTGLEGLQNLYNSVSYIYNNINLSSAAECEAMINYYIESANSADDEATQTSGEIMALYYEAYYLYVYEGDDKNDVTISNTISDLGTYFLKNAYYTDVDNGDWSPSTFSVIPAILYCVFVLQSFMFLFNYIKRLIYVIVLAMLGPVVVLYDYVIKVF